jgi:hypothetical protein
MAPDAMPLGVKELVNVGGLFLNGLSALSATGVNGVQIMGSGIATGVGVACDVFRPLQAQFALFDVDGMKGGSAEHRVHIRGRAL